MPAGQVVSGTLTGNGGGDPFQPIANKPFNVYVYGSFTGNVTLQRSFDNGSSWLSCSKPDLSEAKFTAPVNFVVTEPRPSTTYRVLMDTFGGTSMSYRFEQ